ncbi:transposase [Candidatus Woesearchaeota archaeon]|nr:transposase [Candidatus Woesearchaeota archaeon]
MSSCVKNESQDGHDPSRLYKEIPVGITRYLEPYMGALTKPQQTHFSTFIAGLIINDNKTIQEINDNLSEKDQSSLNRSIQHWNIEELNDIRLEQVQRRLPTRNDGLLIIDNYLAHKSGKKMEGAGMHRSGITKRSEWGHNMVNSYYTHPDWEFGYPITADIFTNRDNADYPYRPIKRMALAQVRHAREHGVRGIVCADTLYYADYVMRELHEQHERYLMGVPSTLKISVKRAPRVSVAEYFEHQKFEHVKIHERTYHVSSVKGSIRGVGNRRIVCSYPDGDPDDKKFYATNLEYPNKKLMSLLVCRWKIECWHRDGKQHLGLEDYQVRKDRAVRNVVLAILIAYTILVLSTLHPTLRRMAKRIGRPLQTIGELCRFMRLTARTRWRWITRMMPENIEALKDVLNREVLVKNAKV